MDKDKDIALPADRAAGLRPQPATPFSQGSIPSAWCPLCFYPGDESPLYPMYGVAPHECYWRKGPEFTIGQSTLIPMRREDCFVPDLEAHEDWSHFTYPSACGVYYCPNCQSDCYRREWDKLVARIGNPPCDSDGSGEAVETLGSTVGDSAGIEDASPVTPSATATIEDEKP